MHRTALRPAPLNFLPPLTHSTNSGNDRRKNIGLHSSAQFAPYFDAPIRDGLQTPPADDMSTAYQQSQYNNYAGKLDVTYSTPVSSGSGYAGVYTSANTQAKSNPSLGQLPPVSISASSVSKEVQALQPHYPQLASPQPANRTNTVIPADGLPRRKCSSNDMITPNLQIPLTINNSGGSLAEFAAQVFTSFSNLPVRCLIVSRLPAFSGSSLPKLSTKPSNFCRRHLQ